MELYGEESSEVGSDLHNIGVVLICAGKYDKALTVCDEAVQIRRAVLGSHHPDVDVSLVEKGIVLLAREAFDEALVHFSDALTIRRNAFGSKHPHVANVLNNIGCVHMELGELDHALDAYMESLDIQKHVTCEWYEAEYHILTIAALQCNIGCIMLKRKEYDAAASIFEEVLLVSLILFYFYLQYFTQLFHVSFSFFLMTPLLSKVQCSVLGDVHSSIILTLDRLGYANAMIGDFSRSLEVSSITCYC